MQGLESIQVMMMGVLQDGLQFAQQRLVTECHPDIRHISPGHIIACHSSARVVRSQPVLLHLGRQIKAIIFIFDLTSK